MISGTIKVQDEKKPQATSGAAKQTSEELSAGRKRIVSKTLGEIYASQGQIRESIKVFEKLLEQNPDDESIKRKISELKKL
jgi:tetratricopeptide (TPR) repeat protein